MSDPGDTLAFPPPPPASEGAGLGAIQLPARFLRPVLVARTGSAWVFRARDAKRGVDVAVKVVAGGQGTPPLHAAVMTHPNVVRVYEWIEIPPGRCCVMEYVDGPSLAMVIERLRAADAADAVSEMNAERLLAVMGLNAAALAPEIREAAAPPRPYARLVCEWLTGLCGAVAHLHAHGVVHLDIKPANVLIGTDATPRLGDFGASQSRGVAGSFAAATASYIAPERLADLVAPGGSSPEPASDIWGLGLVLYELLHLHPAYEGATVHEAIRAVATLDPAASEPASRTTPRALWAVCARALRRDPAERFGSAQAFADALREVGDEVPGAPRRAPRPRSGSTP